MASFGASAICTWKSFSAPDRVQAVDRDSGRERAEGIEREPDRGVIDLPHDFPGIAVIADVPGPGQRLESHAQSARGGALSELAEIIDDAAAIRERMPARHWSSPASGPCRAPAGRRTCAPRDRTRGRALAAGIPSKSRNGWNATQVSPRSRIMAPMTCTGSGEASRSLSKISTCSKPASAIARSLVRSGPLTEMVAMQLSNWRLPQRVSSTPMPSGSRNSSC